MVRPQNWPLSSQPRPMIVGAKSALITVDPTGEVYFALAQFLVLKSFDMNTP